nr:MAG TPA: hypothetical protein [Caudoviricetes sp.]
MVCEDKIDARLTSNRVRRQKRWFAQRFCLFCIFPPCAHYPWACYHAGRPVEGQRRTSPSPIFEGCHEQGRFTSGGCSLVRGVWHTPQVREL